METTKLLQILARDGELLADAAERAELDARVASCPEWTVRDLVAHTGRIHRWATGFVAHQLTEPRRPPQDPELQGAELLAWFREGHGALVSALRSAPDDLECWTFLPSPTPRAFWARRQAHETAIHRVDAELARGAGVSLIDADFAMDGVDELLTGFHGRERSRVHSEQPVVLRLHSTDTAARWTVRLSDGPLAVERQGEGAAAPQQTAIDEDTEGAARTQAAQCTLIGSTADLYLTLWNRPPSGEVRTEGDTAVAALWRETSAIV
ncbi:maleylpyruvate isomerase family mycothiol-dependent enzyme [Streptomyces zagrosensis]|uniref:Uncharacterized protein (TIGR03083 family) n=1 Tax=Streptomyces zagrosensis TaxID=1042984 RepID=A0A7W9UY86_9ACTN|nr:maleylpyruvate isomerase family mycothiol-dependent enzyme [Streptomyces zagrosensis]MBB5935387.1 uncharacterized protein (TIGR03083 family) [Streptomyces zagrosensis]